MHACAAAQSYDAPEVEELIELLVTLGGTRFISVANDRGATAMHLAAHHGKAALVEQLVRHGADLLALDRESQEPLAYAKNPETERTILKLSRHA